MFNQVDKDDLVLSRSSNWINRANLGDSLVIINEDSGDEESEQKEGFDFYPIERKDSQIFEIADNEGHLFSGDEHITRMNDNIAPVINHLQIDLNLVENLNVN